MPGPSSMEKQKAVPMIFRHHGDTTPKTRGHTLGGQKSNSFYVRQLENSQNTEDSLKEQTNSLSLSKPFCPSFIAYDKKVLRFGAFFLEAVHESHIENYRVRKCEILYYLEDHTIQITEPKVENSGILQGNFVKRHKIPKQEVPLDTNGNVCYFTFQDLNIGQEITLYGRTFHIISADPFTRNFLQENHIFVPQDEEPPRDTYTEVRKAHMSRETGQDPNAHYGKKQYPMKEFMEASLGKFARPADHLRRFLEHDRHVLRFFALWDDTSKLYGMKHRYTLHYFLADNTIEILESYERNSGCDPFPKLLNRTKLHKNRSISGQTATSSTTFSTEENEIPLNYYTWQDLEIGRSIQIFNRDILILDADSTTREWYEEKGKPLKEAIVIQDEIKTHASFVPPPHNGIGSEEDSLQSCYHLVPKAPSKSIEQLENKEVLRFRARFETNKPEDIERRFIVSIFVADQSISVMEPVQRNSGIVGGKFLERSRVKKNDGTYWGLKDFYIGAKVFLAGRIFVIYEMDEHSALYMEQNTKLFPKADPNGILFKLRQFNTSLLQQKLKEAINKTKKELDAEELTSFFQEENILCQHEAVTLIRAFGQKEKGTITIENISQLLLQN